MIWGVGYEVKSRVQRGALPFWIPSFSFLPSFFYYYTDGFLGSQTKQVLKLWTTKRKINWEHFVSVSYVLGRLPLISFCGFSGYFMMNTIGCKWYSSFTLQFLSFIQSFFKLSFLFVCGVDKFLLLLLLVILYNFFVSASIFGAILRKLLEIFLVSKKKLYFSWDLNFCGAQIWSMVLCDHLL